MAGVACFFCPVVGVVPDATFLVGGDLVALHDPLDGAFAVNDVTVCFFGYTGYGDVAVVDDGLFFALFGKAHY